MKLPPLAAFRYFDLAARTGSFVQAAAQLHVTHGAVSRQIRQLEAALGQPLFERRNRAVHLNAAGRQLQAATALAFDQLADAVQRLSARRDDKLVLSCEPTLAMRWLIPRLPAFHRKHPGVQLHLLAAGGDIDFAHSGADLALRRNDFQWGDDIVAERLCDEWMGPVSACPLDPAFGLNGQTLLHAQTRPKAWAAWSGQTGVKLPRRQRTEYEHFYLCLQAALCRQGVAMASFLMVQDELASGQLLAPFGFVRDGSAYFLLAPAAFDRKAGGRAVFRRWLLKELGESEGALIRAAQGSPNSK